MSGSDVRLICELKRAAEIQMLFLDILAGHAGEGIVASLVGQRARQSEGSDAAGG